MGRQRPRFCSASLGAQPGDLRPKENAAPARAAFELVWIENYSMIFDTTLMARLGIITR